MVKRTTEQTDANSHCESGTTSRGQDELVESENLQGADSINMGSNINAEAKLSAPTVFEGSCSSFGRISRIPSNYKDFILM